MKKILLTLLLMIIPCYAQASGFGVQLGAFSPTDGLNDNDNSVLFGAHFKFKLAFFALKLEGFYVDSSGDYPFLDDEFNAEATIDIESMFALDFMFYPLGTTLFVQAGVNYTSLDTKNIDFDAVDNELGADLGLGITLFDKLMIQGKIVYTPNALKGSAADVLGDLDENLLGDMVSVGWNF